MSKIKHPIIIELGAHFGISTAKIKTLAPDSTYYAFEPNILNLKILWSIFRSPYVRIIPQAVCNVDGKIKFYLSGGINKSGRVHTDSSSIKKPIAHEKMFPWMSFNEAMVDCVKLDTFCELHGIDHIDLIWADVQGAELDVIAGGQKMFRNTHWFYTEHMNEPRYKDQPNLGQILEALPDEWYVIVKWEMDALLRNRQYVGASGTQGTNV